MTYVVPFTLSLYVFTLMTFILCTIAFYVTSNVAKDKNEYFDFPLGLCTMTVAHGLLLQSTSFEPSKISSRFSNVFNVKLSIQASFSIGLYLAQHSMLE